MARLSREGMYHPKNEVPLDALWGMRNSIAELREGKHDIYWGCHACDRERGHKGKCECKCGAKPGRYSMFWGDDFKGFSEEELYKRMRGMGKEDTRIRDIVIVGLKESLVNGKYRESRRAQVVDPKSKYGGGKKTGYSR